MKKLFFLAVLFSANFAFAQQNNTWVFSGELGFRSDILKYTQGNQTNNETKQSRFFVRVGHVFTQTNFEIGTSFGYTNYKRTSIFTSTPNTFITLNFAPYVKKYFTINDKFAFHLIGEIGYGKTYEDNSFGNDDLDVQEFGVVIRPGFVYFLTNHFALTSNLGSFGYISTTSKYNSSNDTKTESFGFNFNGSNILFGIAYYL